MSINEGGADRFARWSIGCLMVLIALSGTGTAWPIAFAVIGGLLLVTGTIGHCPLYSALNVTTMNRDA